MYLSLFYLERIAIYLKIFFKNKPWLPVNDDMAERLQQELVKELSREHVLYGTKAQAIAKREDNDDVVFWISAIEQYAIVHLTYAQETSKIFPITKLFSAEELEEYCKHIFQYYERE
ncbi:hypothetical protein I6G82_07400 [Lysinibacillus macroides]|nr:hypothetical protein I6G82_07400 [Lysinibacillus macroides]